MSHGVLLGVPLIALTKMVGGLFGFLVARKLLRVWVEGRVGKSPEIMKRMYEGVEENGFKTALLLRLSPLPSYLCTYGLAITKLSFRDFALSTLFGSLPVTLSYYFSFIIS